jgi:Relaxase/Mobilisation nuclease domain
MISKIFITGKTFRESCFYVCEDLERSQILEAEGVRAHDLQLMAQDFETQQMWANQVKEKPVFHEVLSFPHGENPGDEKLLEIGRRQLEKIGMADTQHVIVKHTDKEHLHLHILANRVSNTGEIVGEGLVIERGIKAARELTDEYHLQPDQGKNLRETNFQALHEPDARRYRLYEAIKEVLPDCQRMEELEMRLLERGISTRYRIDRGSGERQGISFRIENYCFKGSEVDRAYSLKGLEGTLALQQKQAIEQKLAMEQRQALEQAQALERVEAERQRQVMRQNEPLSQEQVQEQVQRRERDEDLRQKQEQREETRRQMLRQGPRLRP